MDKHSAHRRRAPLTVASAILFILASSAPAVGSQGYGMILTGAGVGPTPDVAIQGAVWDAEASASAYQLYNCQLVGQPLLFPSTNSRWGRNFFAEATVACTQ